MAQVQSSRGLPPSGAARGSSAAYSKTYNSFSGVDMQCTFAGKVIGELEGLSFTIQREKAPIYTMGSADPRSYSRGKRGIAGSVVFTVLDRSALLEVNRDRPYIANRYDVPAGFEVADVNVDVIERASGLIGSLSGSASPSVSRVVLDKILARPQYLDQVLPFDIVLTAANEYGSFARMVLHQVEILNVGSSMSVDDIQTTEACTYVACGLTPWSDQGFIKINDDGRSATVSN